MRHRILDLFCGAGGAAMGYHRAGFDVIGVDIVPQPHYPFEFHRYDALAFARALSSSPDLGCSYDAIHASPPCQRYSRTQRLRSNDHPDMIAATRDLLEDVGLPWVIENVPGAPLRNPVVLCGTSFGLGMKGFELRRHRWFEASFPMLVPPCRHNLPAFPIFGHSVNTWFREKYGCTFSNEDRRTVLGADWLPWDRIGDAIPPAFTDHIGGFLIDYLDTEWTQSGHPSAANPVVEPKVAG